MKPIWREFKVVQISRQLHEKYSCIADCGKKERCSVVIPISKEPPTECISEYKNSDMVEPSTI